MSGEENLEELQKSLMSSYKEISIVLKAFGEPNRLKILIQLLSGPQTFQELSDKTGLGKTGLANHLAKLTKAALIEKIHHGMYEITYDGQEFLKRIKEAYQNSQKRKRKKMETLQRKQLVETFLSSKQEPEKKLMEQRKSMVETFLQADQAEKDNDE